MTEEKEKKVVYCASFLSLCVALRREINLITIFCFACCQRKGGGGGGGGQWLFCDFRKPFFPLISTALCCSSSLYYIFFKGSFARKQSSDPGPENYSPRGQRGNFSLLSTQITASFAREKFGKGGGGGDPH